MAALGMSPICYNHPEKRADFKCFDCKYENIINLCAQCNIQVHSLDVFRAHKVEGLELKAKERRLSQDVSDIEKLIAVENDLLQNVLTKLKYTEVEEKETLSQLIHLQNAAKKRIAEIKDCEAKIEKAFNYLAKVSSMLTQCSSPVGDGQSEAKEDPFAVPIETPSTVKQPSGAVVDSSDQPCAKPPQEPVGEDQKKPVGEDQKSPAKEHCINLPDELKGKDVFPVCVVGSLARNGSFWIAKIGEPEMEKQRQIQATIRKHYLQHGFGDPVVLKEGVLCAVLHRQVKEYTRARIELVTTSGRARLRFLDFGIVDEFSQSSLCQLPLDVVDISFQALECCLLCDPETQLPYEAKWCFKDLTYNKILMASVEGQVTDKKGHVLQHVMLGSCGEIPVCINSKVAKLVEDQKHGLEDRPLQPKPEKVETVDSVGGENTVKQQTLEAATFDDHAQDTVTKMADTNSSTSEEEEVLAKTDTEISVTDQVAAAVNITDVPVEENGNVSEDKPMLRAEAAEFVPVSQESEVPGVPGILHLPMQEKAASVMPVNTLERFNSIVSDTQLPAGCVDFETYNHILTKCSLNLICKEDLPRARFLMIRSDIRRIVEGMKFNVWCSTAYGNKKLNRVFGEVANRDQSPVFLLFSGIKTSMFCGMAEMVSAVDFTKSCPKLNDPFRFGSKMTGRCEIKWIYASNVYFADVITPNCGFPRRYLEEATDGYEIANKLGQMIVCAFDSSGNFESILQQAMKDYQFYLTNQQHVENRDRKSYDAELLRNTQSEPFTTEETSNGLPPSQEDWDQEIEESLKARNYYEVDQVDVSSAQEAPKDIPPETVETDFSSVSEVVTHVSLEDTSLQAGTSAATSCGPVLSIKGKEIVSSDGDSVTASDGEEVVTNSDDTHDQKGTCVIPELKEGYDDQIKGPDKDVGLLSVGSMVGEDPVEASLPSSQEMEAEGSSPKEREEDVNEDPKIECTGEEHNKDGYLDSADKSVHTVPHACSSSGVEANEDVLDPWEESVQLGPLVDPVTDDSNVVASTEDSQDSYHVSGMESIHNLHCVFNSSGVEANEDDREACGESSVDPCLVDLCDDVMSEDPVNGEEQDKHDPVLSDLCTQEVLSQGSSEDLLSDYEYLPVEIGKEHWIVATESVSSSGTFWARVVRTSKEEASFVDDMERMGAHIEAQNRPLDPAEIHLYKQCAVKGLDDYWYRALVEKNLDRGKIYIRLLDLGESWEVHQKDLRVLDDEFYASPPAQAFECSLCYENPSNRKERTRISKFIKKNKKLRVLVKNFSREGTVGVQVLP